MKDLKIWLTGLAILAWAGSATAQNEVDALRYSNLSFGGTARIQGLAGAQTALGADASSMYGNPAGLGFYRKSEFTFSPGLNFNDTESQFGGTALPDKINKFIIPQFGIVFTDRKPDEVISKWRSGTFGIGFTRLNNFNVRTIYEGTISDDRSLLQSFQDRINQGEVSAQTLIAEQDITGNGQFLSIPGLAYDTRLIEIDSLNQLYVPVREGPIGIGETIISKGSQNQWDFSYGASYLDKLFIGGTLGLSSVRYEQTRTYTETAGSQEPYFSNLSLSDHFKTSGTGINLKVGLIYKPVDVLRLGATIVTPTFYSLRDQYSTSLRAEYKPGALPNSSSQTPDGVFDYNLTTPFRANGGVAYFIGKYGFISGDVEYVDYSNASYSLEDDVRYFRPVNNLIAANYQSAINFRVGAEARFDIFRVRGGFAHYGDPYSGTTDQSRKFFTGGIGIREINYFVDAAYVHSTGKTFYQPYQLESNLQPVVETQNRNASFIVTAGFNF